MIVQRDKILEEHVHEKISEWLNKKPREEGVHVSDLLYPRKTYWRKIDPKPNTKEENLYFIAGQGHHFVIESMLEPKTDTSTDSGTHEVEGILYSPDLRCPVLLEIKTTRKKLEPKSENLKTEYDSYLKQLTAYMALENKPTGSLLVFFLNKINPIHKSKTDPVIRCYNVRITNKELLSIRRWLVESKKKLLDAIQTKNHRTLDLCPRWLCKGCQWLQQCKPWEDDDAREGLNETSFRPRKIPA